MNTRILLVEDNPLTAKGLTYLLEHESYQVTVAPDLAAARALDLASFQLVLLDVSLPDGEGFQLAQEIHTTAPHLPIIFLTARDDEADIIKGLELGAKDYITKPFRNRELLLKIRNHLQSAKPAAKVLTFGNFIYDFSNDKLTVDDQTVVLTALERRLFLCLLEAQGNIVSRERLLDEIWEASGKVVNDNTLSVYLKRIREKLGQPDAIQTVKNLGYRLCVGKVERA